VTVKKNSLYKYGAISNHNCGL